MHTTMRPPCLLLLLLLFLHTCDAAEYKCLEDRTKDAQKALSSLIRQLTLQQLYVEEMTRSTYDSGVKQVRRRKDGPKSYYTNTISGYSICSIHNHDNNIRTVGMGEFIAILNGLEFRTRHNDYRLKMPSTTSGEYHAVEDLPFPEVPPQVLNKNTVEEQIAEMKEWFKAWLSGDYSVRDYREYFRPNLCYLEGAWTTDVGENVDEPFESDRHHIEADTWFEMQEQIRFTSSTGNKNFQENFSYLPTTIINITEDDLPVFSQWNYRILCHPIEGDLLDLSHLKPVDDLANRLSRGKTYDRFLDSRAVRFRLESPEDQPRWSLLDKLMYQIPGKDNYKANITDSSFDKVRVHVITEEILNSGRYHRVYRVSEKDAMGEMDNYKGFADRNLFVAQTTQSRIAALSVPFCKNKWVRRQNQCVITTQRVSYALPLEIIYLTPLQTWNPRGVVYRGVEGTEEGNAIRSNGQNGNQEKPYDGINSKCYYMTPYEFYNGADVGLDSADTTRSKVWVLNASGTPHPMKSSGVRISLPNIPGVGVARTRFPIMPLAIEGHAAWKELEALRDVVMDMEHHIRDFPTPPPFPDEILQKLDPSEVRVTLRLEPAENATTHSNHTHLLYLSAQQNQQARSSDGCAILYTSKTNGHSHQLDVSFHKGKYQIQFCDRQPNCYDGHAKVLTVL